MTSHADERPSRQVLLQRVRNRIIEYLEVASSIDAQRSYQEQAPTVNVPNEVIHQWEDWVSEDWEAELIEPVFSAEERAAIARLYQVWVEVTSRAPDPLPSLELVIKLPEWAELRDAAGVLLNVFGKRGKFSEDAENVLN